MTTVDTDPVDDGALYGIVEIMGHRTRAGRLSDATLGGATFLRVEHPTALDHRGDPLAEYYGRDALFAVRPCSRDDAIDTCRWAWPGPIRTTPELPSAALDFVDHDDEDLNELLGHDDDVDDYDHA